MSREFPEVPWIHIGQCPVCDDGLCRVRCSIGENGAKQIYALCDECEAIFLQPSTETKFYFPDPEEAKSPFSDESLYGQNSRWATLDDVLGTPWENEVIIVADI